MLRLKGKSVFLGLNACLFLGFISIWGLMVFSDKKKGEFTVPAEYAIHRQVRYEFTLQNTEPQLLEKAEFWTYAPVKQTASQRCEKISASHPFELLTDDVGNQILYFKLDALSPYATRIIRITADLLLSDRPNSAILTDPARWLQAEKYMEASHPGLQRTARQLKSSDGRQTAEKTFQWVAGNIKYAGYIKNDRGALYAHTYRKGDCTEYMYLFAALCRVNNIPARGVGGYICPENTILRADRYHNWAEFYKDDAWRIADPQNKVFVKNTADYIAMRIIQSEPTAATPGRFNRFAFKGEGLKVSMN